MSAEPSMEEILSSIKRIIAEEGESPIRGRRPARPVPPPEDDAEVLELRDPLGEPDADRFVEQVNDPLPIAAPSPITSSPTTVPTAARPVPAPPAPAPIPAAVEEAAPAPQEPPVRMADPALDSILSPRTAEASRSSLDSLSRLLVKPDAGSDGTLEGLVREMLRPMLRDWLDTNLPPMVETMVAAEIARISGQPR